MQVGLAGRKGDSVDLVQCLDSVTDQHGCAVGTNHPWDTIVADNQIEQSVGVLFRGRVPHPSSGQDGTGEVVGEADDRVFAS